MNEVVRDLEKFAHAYNLDDMDRASEPFGNHTIEKLKEFGLTAKMPNYISVSGQMLSAHTLDMLLVVAKLNLRLTSWRL